jgi:hypothetical protein
MFKPPTPNGASARRFTALVALATIAACASTAGRSGGEIGGASVSTADAVDSAVLVTRLGVDTMAIERVVYAAQRVEADVHACA